MLRKMMVPLFMMVSAAGCSDNLDGLLRDARNKKNELIDIVIKVNDEADAKLAKDKLIPKATKQFEDATKDRLDKWEKGHQLTKTFNDITFKYAKEKSEPFDLLTYDKGITNQLLKKLKEENRAIVEETFNSFAAYYRADLAALKRLDTVDNRLDQILNKLTEEKKAELRAKGQPNPSVDPKEFWPSLVEVKTREIPAIRKKKLTLAGITTSSPFGGGPPGGGPPGGPGGGQPGGGQPGGPGGGQPGGPGGGQPGGPGGGQPPGGGPPGGNQGGFPDGKQ